MTYLIEFKYEATQGQVMTSRVYSRTELNAEKVIKKHLDDHRTPRVIEWRLYELLREGKSE